MKSLSQRHRTLYHGTSAQRAGSIERSGLSSPNGRYTDMNFMLAAEPYHARAYAHYAALIETRKHAKPAVLTFEIPEEEMEEYFFRPGTQFGPYNRPITVYAPKKRIPARYVTQKQVYTMEEFER